MILIGCFFHHQAEIIENSYDYLLGRLRHSESERFKVYTMRCILDDSHEADMCECCQDDMDCKSNKTDSTIEIINN